MHTNAANEETENPHWNRLAQRRQEMPSAIRMWSPLKIGGPHCLHSRHQPWPQVGSSTTSHNITTPHSDSIIFWFHYSWQIKTKIPGSGPNLGLISSESSHLSAGVYVIRANPFRPIEEPRIPNLWSAACQSALSPAFPLPTTIKKDQRNNGFAWPRTTLHSS